MNSKPSHHRRRLDIVTQASNLFSLSPQNGFNNQNLDSEIALDLSKSSLEKHSSALNFESDSTQNLVIDFSRVSDAESRSSHYSSQTRPARKIAPTLSKVKFYLFHGC
jgi:hypothetical protein